MAENVIARLQGDHYQALFFWSEATKLLRPNQYVEKVTWESNTTAGYDDVVTQYVAPGRRCDDLLITKDHFQIKHHVSQAKAFTCAALIDPDFIGTTKATILSRLYDIYKQDDQIVTNSRFIIINTWGVDTKDPLGVLIGSGGALRMEILFDGKSDSSKFGKIRRAWREHLQIETDDELRKVLTPLRIRHSYPDIDLFLDMLSERLELAKLQPLTPDQRSLGGLVELIQRLHAGGRKEFTRDELQRICEEEGIVLSEVITEDVHVIGVRSFYKGAQELHLEVHDMLCLLDKFVGRFPGEKVSWPEIYDEIQMLAQKAIDARKPVKLHLDTHLSLAFGMGYVLNSKSGVVASVVQKTANKKLLWSVDLDTLPQQPSNNWDFSTHFPESGGNDLTVCVSVTHDILHDVLQFEQMQQSRPGTILSALINPAPSGTVFKSGNHIYTAVQELIARIRREKQSLGSGATVRLYMSAPVAFAFFFGQLAGPLGKIVLFEYDFEQTRDGSYHQTISLPILKH
ncbi:SAVED domain-containing protein [Chitinophaga oryzae]|uniref:SAVED domain-containing protein n=1 Tax=Chitinophaga oryzae TaxID=2725414 RepID=A0ABX6LUG0_9BACT|nr:SAVED domain-containing protein [Chitinophaga oryzae]QJB42445.1 SAVED domain-containing protein [Chitinophaga oryzae]